MNLELFGSQQKTELKIDIRNFATLLEQKYSNTVKGNEAGFKSLMK